MPRKGENIYKRQDGRWEGRYIKSRSPAGKACYGYVYAKTYRDVKVKLKDAAACRYAGSANNVFEGSFEETARKWLEETMPFIKESTSNKYWNLLKSYILPEIGMLSLSRINREVLENLCNYLLKSGGVKKAGLSTKTVRDVLSVIHSILQYCVRKGYSISCDTQTIQIKQQAGKMRVLSRSEQEKLCRYLYSDLNAGNLGILLCLFTGLRIGEVCALRWEDISLADQTIHVHQTIQRVQDRSAKGKKTKVIVTPPKSACSVRTIPIPDDIVRILTLYQKEGGAGFLLTNGRQRYMEPRTMQYQFKRALKKSNVASANFHALRHTFATRCVELGFDVKSLSEILGHASVNITMNRYVHPSMELKKENMQRLSSLLPVK